MRRCSESSECARNSDGGVSREIADALTMSVVCKCWSVLAHNESVLYVLDSFGVYYVFIHELE